MADPRDKTFEGVLEVLVDDLEGETERHTWLRSIENKRVRVTVEIL